jgi:arsenite-transporting ATPase
MKWAASESGIRASAEALVGSETCLALFGGKGGVGKTTCAAAAAIACAQRWPDRTVLLISTDPAHSVADVLGAPVGDRESRIRGAPPNLLAREMDAAQVFARIRAHYSAAIDRAFDRITRGSLDVVHDRSIVRALIDLAPPGLDELAAVAEITDRVSTSSQALTIVDMAPTGHALRLLEMPELIHDWTKALMAILLKYQPVAGLGDLGSLLLDLSKKLGRLRVVLADHRQTRFIVVTRPAALPRNESERLMRSLHALRIGVPVVMFNAVGRGECSRCRRSASAERREVHALAAALRRSRSAPAIVTTTTVIPPPGSAAALTSWQRSGWRYHQDP